MAFTMSASDFPLSPSALFWIVFSSTNMLHEAVMNPFRRQIKCDLRPIVSDCLICHRLWDLWRDGTGSCMDPRGSGSCESPRNRSNEEPWQPCSFDQTPTRFPKYWTHLGQTAGKEIEVQPYHMYIYNIQLYAYKYAFKRQRMSLDSSLQLWEATNCLCRIIFRHQIFLWSMYRSSHNRSHRKSLLLKRQRYGPCSIDAQGQVQGIPHISLSSQTWNVIMACQVYQHSIHLILCVASEETNSRPHKTLTGSASNYKLRCYTGKFHQLFGKLQQIFLHIISWCLPFNMHWTHDMYKIRMVLWIIELLHWQAGDFLHPSSSYNW